MTKLQFLLLFLCTSFFACKKQLSSETASPEKTATKNFESMYFDLKSNPDVKMPGRFSSLKEAQDFLTKNYKRVNKDGTPYGTATKPNARMATTLDDDIPAAEEMSYNSGSTFGIVSPDQSELLPEYNLSSYPTTYSDFCEVWRDDPYRTVYLAGGSKHIWEQIEAVYDVRGIICVLKFGVKYAPRLHASRPKMVYAASDWYAPSLTITGGALGVMSNQPSVSLTMQPEGRGQLYASQTETRTYIITHNSNHLLKAGGSENYPIGMTLENGETVKSSFTSVTSYTLYYRLQFYDEYSFHDHNFTGDPYIPVVCQFGANGNEPIMSYEDVGTVFTGIPRN